MIPNSIKELMSKQQGQVKRPSEDAEKVVQCLKDLGLEGHEQLHEFFTTYRLSGVLSKTSPEELMDLASPTPQIAEVTEFVRDTYGVLEDFVCLTTGEGEGFYLYSKSDRRIYNVGVDELDALEAGEKKAEWNSFFELLEWYLR